jgi:hypothetical protein
MYVHPRFLCAVHVAQSLVFCVVFCRSLFIRFCWSWRCLSISNLLLLSAHFISSSFSSCGNINFHFGVLPCHLHRLLLVTFAYRIYLKNCSLDVRQQSINHITLLKFLSETKDKHSHLKHTMVYQSYQLSIADTAHSEYMTGVTCGTGTTYPAGAQNFTPGFKWGSCCSIFSFLWLFLLLR